MTLRPLAVTALALAALTVSGCGGDDAPADGGSGDSADAGPAGVEADEAGASSVASGMVGVAADQLQGQIGATGYELNDRTLTFTFDDGPESDGSAIPTNTAAGQCEISRTVIDAVAAGEVETLVMKYPDSVVDCSGNR